MTVITGLAFLTWASALGLAVLGSWLARNHFRRREVASQPSILPEQPPMQMLPITVLKPVKGVEFELAANLETFFHLIYPRFELVFSVADAADPAVVVIERLIRQYPNVEARLIVGAEHVGPNPKVNNMYKGYQEAAYDWILISDSNVRVGPDYLSRLARHMRDDVGVVTAVVAGTRPSSLGGHLEAMFLNTFYARWMMLASRAGQPCVIGKSMLFRKSHAQRFGGMRTLSKYLAEDYIAGEAMRLLGLKVVIMSDPIDQPIGSHTVGHFWSRHIRWGRLRKSQAPVAFLFEPWLGSVSSGCVGAFAFWNWGLLSPVHFLALHFFAWALADAVIARKISPARSWLQPLVWIIRELIAVPLWLHIASGNSVMWRGHRLKLLSGGTLEEPAQTASLPVTSQLSAQLPPQAPPQLPTHLPQTGG